MLGILGLALERLRMQLYGCSVRSSRPRVTGKQLEHQFVLYITSHTLCRVDSLMTLQHRAFNEHAPNARLHNAQRVKSRLLSEAQLQLSLEHTATDIDPLSLSTVELQHLRAQEAEIRRKCLDGI